MSQLRMSSSRCIAQPARISGLLALSPNADSTRCAGLTLRMFLPVAPAEASPALETLQCKPAITPYARTVQSPILTWRLALPARSHSGGRVPCIVLAVAMEWNAHHCCAVWHAGPLPAKQKARVLGHELRSWSVELDFGVHQAHARLGAAELPQHHPRDRPGKRPHVLAALSFLAELLCMRPMLT